jgi:hypothetical protein
MASTCSSQRVADAAAAVLRDAQQETGRLGGLTGVGILKHDVIANGRLS